MVVDKLNKIKNNNISMCLETIEPSSSRLDVLYNREKHGYKFELSVNNPTNCIF